MCVRVPDRLVGRACGGVETRHRRRARSSRRRRGRGDGLVDVEPPGDEDDEQDTSPRLPTKMRPRQWLSARLSPPPDGSWERHQDPGQLSSARQVLAFIPTRSAARVVAKLDELAS